MNLPIIYRFADKIYRFADIAMHSKMVMLVERMLELNKKKAAEKGPGIMQQLETQITATDNQIDQLVYKLCDLTEDEITLVENKG